MAKKVEKKVKKVKKFSDVKVPKTEHAKKLAQEKANKVLRKELNYTVVSVQGNKLLKYGVTPKGVYSIYIANVKKLGDKKFQILKKKYAEKGQWVESHELQNKILELKKSFPGYAEPQESSSDHEDEIFDDELDLDSEGDLE